MSIDNPGMKGGGYGRGRGWATKSDIARTKNVSQILFSPLSNSSGNSRSETDLSCVKPDRLRIT